MEDILYMLSEYPFVAFLVLFFVMRAIFGGGEKAKLQKQKQAEARAKVIEAKKAKKSQKAHSSSNAIAGEGILAQIQRQLEEAARQIEDTQRGQLSSSEESLSMSRPEIRMSGPTDAEMSANVERAAMERTELEKLFARETTARAEKAEESIVDYDTNAGGFEYHSASRKPVSEKPEDVLWHLKKQQPTHDAYAFQSADSPASADAYHMQRRKYTSAARIEAPKVSTGEIEHVREPIAVNDLFANMDSLTRAFILQEVMGRPRGMRLNNASWLRPR